MNFLSIFLYQFYRKALKHSKKTITLFCIAIAFSLVGASRVQTLTRLDDFLDTSFQSTQDYLRVKDLFFESHRFLIAIEKQGGGHDSEFNSQDLCAVDQFIKKFSSQFPEVTRIQSPISIRRAEYDPVKRTLWFPHVLEGVCNSNQNLLAEINVDPWRGTLLPSQSQHHDLLIEVYFGGDFRHENVPAIKNWISDELRGHPFVLHYSGEVEFQYYTDVGYQWVDKLNLLIAVMLLLWCWLFFRTLKSGFILLATLSITGLILRGFMGYTHSPIDILSSNLFLMLAVSCIEDYILLSSVRMTHSNWKTAFRLILVPGFLTSLTTLIGFWSLAYSDIGMIRRFGWIAGLGSLIEWLVVFILLPCVIQEFSSLKQWVKQPFSPFWKNLEQKLKNLTLPKPVLYACLLVFPIGLWAATHLVYRENPENTFWASHPFRLGLDYLAETRGYRNQLSFVFEANASHEKKTAVGEWLHQVPEVIRIENPNQIAHQLFKNTPPEIEASFEREVKESSAFNRWMSKSGEERWILYWNGTETNRMAEFNQEVRSHCAGDCFLAGSFVAYSEMGNRLSHTLLESLVVSLALVGLVLIWLARHQGFRRYWVVCVSAFWGAFATLNLLWITQRPIYFISCLFAATLVGISGDNIIQFLWRSRRRGRVHRMNEMGLGAGLLTLSIIGMASCFLAAYFVPARSLGVLLSVGLVAMFFGDYFIWKGLQSTLERSEPQTAVPLKAPSQKK